MLLGDINIRGACLHFPSLIFQSDSEMLGNTGPVFSIRKLAVLTVFLFITCPN